MQILKQSELFYKYLVPRCYLQPILKKIHVVVPISAASHSITESW